MSEISTTNDTAAEAGADRAPEAGSTSKARGKHVFTLIPDTRGALVNGGLFSLYLVASMTIALRSEPNTGWFYTAYFLACMAILQGVTVVFRHCLHATSKAVVEVEVVGKVLRLTRKNGERVDLDRDVDYTRRSRVLVLAGSTHDKQKVSEVVREGALPDGDMDRLVASMKRFR